MKSVKDTEGYNFVRNNGSHYLCTIGAIRWEKLPTFIIRLAGPESGSLVVSGSFILLKYECFNRELVRQIWLLCPGYHLYLCGSIESGPRKLPLL
jgi:hypothetical protein